VLYSLSGAVSGRASFKDTLAVGIGDPFDFLKRELAFVAVSRLTTSLGGRFVAQHWSGDGAHIRWPVTSLLRTLKARNRPSQFGTLGPKSTTCRRSSLARLAVAGQATAVVPRSSRSGIGMP
jgi:hypothetical protein